MKNFAKSLVRVAAIVFVLPWLGLYWIQRPFLGEEQAFQGISQGLSMLPGLSGSFLRVAFYQFTLVGCGPNCRIEFGTLFSKTETILDDYAYLGPRCQIGWAHIQKDCLLAAGVHVPSGGKIHGSDDLDIPIREQTGEATMVTIGEGSWIGSNAVVMADIGKGCIIGAGSVVTKPVPDYSIAAGIPAKIVRSRQDQQ